MPSMIVRIVAIAALGLDSASAVAAGPRQPATSIRNFDERQPAHGSKRHATPAPAYAHGPYVDRAAPYKANRLSLRHASEPILNTPGQTTVLTRQVLDDKNPTSTVDALRTTAGVTVGR